MTNNFQEHVGKSVLSALLWQSPLNFTMITRTAADFHCRSCSVRNHITLTELKQSSAVRCCNTILLCENTSMSPSLACGAGYGRRLMIPTDNHTIDWKSVGMLAEIYVSFALCFYRSKIPDNNRTHFCSIASQSYNNGTIIRWANGLKWPFGKF